MEEPKNSGAQGGKLEAPKPNSTWNFMDAPVRLVCRYSNGISESAVARGIGMKGPVLRVMCRTKYELGTTVTAMASFLPTTTPGQVIAVERGKEVGTWLMELRLRPATAPAAEIEGHTTPLMPMPEAAGILARRLESAGWIPFFQAAFEKSDAVERPAMLAAVETAVFSLLQARDLASISDLTNRVVKGAK